MANIQHVAIWVQHLEGIRRFYEKYFMAESNEKYINPTKGFSSYMLSFKEGGSLEIMNRHDIKPVKDPEIEHLGWAHIAIGVGSRERVLELTEILRADGNQIVGEPRTTGDGFFESVVLDPEGNRIEITV
jgi:lactoylglutathione lyase